MHLKHIQKYTNLFYFSRTPLSQAVNKFSDKHTLTEEEVKNVLKKVEKKPDRIYKYEMKDHPGYNIDIKQQLNEVQEMSKKKDKQLKSLQAESNQQSIDPITNKSDIEIKQKQTKPQIKYYKYDLPIPNIDPEIKGLAKILDPEREVDTINLRIWEKLGLNVNSSYDQYELELRNKFNTEIDMYGDRDDEVQIRNEQILALKEDAIPNKLIQNEEYMDQLRRCFSVNMNMPGAMEAEHPHKFLKNVRPIEEFRHTPLIPISDKQMKEWEQRLQAYHRRGFYFEIKKDNILNFVMLLLAGTVGYALIKVVLKREEETGVAIERIKLRRITDNQI